MLALDLTELDVEADRPGLLVLEQGETERLLLEAVRETGMCDVRFGAEAAGLSQDAGGVALTVRAGGRHERVLRAGFAAGCDGAGSFVRSALGLPFDGITYALRPMLADVAVTDARDGLAWPRVRNGRRGLAFAVRIRPRLWRVVELRRGPASGGAEVPDGEVQRCVTELLGAGPAEVVWASRFRIHRRSSPRFRAGRVVLAGDAAHVHSPVGGQGMNAGIGDAHNLAWKLAAALDGGDAGRLLDSYDAERRRAVAGTVTRSTDVATRLFLQTPAVVRRGAFALLRALLRVRSARRRALRRTTMIDLGYAGSPLLDGVGPAGTRLPNVRLRSPDGGDVRVHDLLPPAPAVLDVAEQRAFLHDAPLPCVVRVGPGGYRDPSGRLRALLGGRDGWVLVRPDQHIASAGDTAGDLQRALTRTLGGPAAGAWR